MNYENNAMEAKIKINNTQSYHVLIEKYENYI